MTVASTYTPPQYSGNGSSTAFPFPYAFFSPTDLIVTLYTVATETTIIPVLNGSGSYDYVVTGGQDPNTGEYPFGTVITNNAPPGGMTVTISRAVSPTQQVALTQNAPFPAKTIEGALDRLTMLDQQALDGLARSIRQPQFDTVLDMELPPAAARAGLWAAFDAQGRPTAAAAPGGAVAISSAMQPVVGAASVASAVALLGAPVVLSTIPALRTWAGPATASAVVQGWHGPGDGGEGLFVRVPGDTTSADDGGTIIVDANGARWYRCTEGRLTCKAFGCRGDGVTDDTTAFQKAIDYTVSHNALMVVPTGTYMVTNLTLPSNAAYDVEPPPWYQGMPRLIGLPGATIKKINGGNNTYLVASERWVTNVAFVSSPVWIENLVFDAVGIATYAFVTVSYQSTYIRNVFRGATSHGCFEPVSTMNGTPLGDARSSSQYERNLFINNAGNGFVVDGYVAPNGIVSDYWFTDNIIHDNGPGNAAINQISGWVIRGNHAYWFAQTPASGNWSVFLGSGAPAAISGNVWEGYSTTHAGLEIGGDSTGAVTVDGDQFENGLGCVATFQTGALTPCTLIRVKNCSFVGNTTLQHAYSNAAAELISENNSFQNPAGYQFSAGGGHLGVLRAVNDRIGADQRIYTGRQRQANYSVTIPDGVLYPAAFPCQIGATDPKVIRVTGVLGADETITMPATPSSGMGYRVTRAASATGAFTLHVKASGGSDIYNLGSAGTYADYEFDGAVWVATGTGTAP